MVQRSLVKRLTSVKGAGWFASIAERYHGPPTMTSAVKLGFACHFLGLGVILRDDPFDLGQSG